MRYIIVFIVTCSIVSCQPKKKIDFEGLAHELDSIYKQDQFLRGELAGLFGTENLDTVHYKALVNEQNEIDATNLKRIEEIIEMVGGYPGKSMVGGSASKVAFFVLQHSSEETRRKYLELILEAAENFELNKSYAAMFHDRVLMEEGLPQIYGTQIRAEAIFDSLTGTRTVKRELWPIRDTSIVDSLRLWNGLIPLEDYLFQMGVEINE